MYKKSYYVFLFLFLVSIISHESIFAAEDKTPPTPDKSKSPVIATIDTELLFSKFTSQLNIQEKIIRDYNDFIENRIPANLSMDAKQKLALAEIDKIKEYYSSQVATIITNISNELIKERSFVLVLNQKTFSVKNAIFSPEQQRIEGRIEREEPLITAQQSTNKNTFENYYNQSVRFSAYKIIDLTPELSKRADNLIPHINIQSYRRSLK